MNRRYDDIIDAEHEYEEVQHGYLRQEGWKYKCDTPGALWLWQKQLKDGRIVLSDTRTALYICLAEAEMRCSVSEDRRSEPGEQARNAREGGEDE